MARKTGHSKSSAGETHPRRSSRANKGEGGAIEQLAKVSSRIEPVKKRKKTAQDSMPSDEARNQMAPMQPNRKRCRTKDVPDCTQIRQPTLMISTGSSKTALSLPPPPVSQLRLSPLPFIPPAPVTNPSHYGLQPVTAPRPLVSQSTAPLLGAQSTAPASNVDEGTSSSSSSSSGDEDGSSSSEDGSRSSETENNLEPWEISDNEDERNAMAIIRGDPSSAPPPYNLQAAAADPNIDPALQAQHAATPLEKSRKKKPKKNHGHSQAVQPPGFGRIQTSTDQSTDVVEEHRNRNTQPRLPDPTVLERNRDELDAHLKKVGKRKRTSRISPVSVPIPGAPSETPEPPTSGNATLSACHSQRASRNSLNPPTVDNAIPTMLRYYGSEWQAVLKIAKNLYRLWLVRENAYPASAQGYQEASEVIQEAISSFKQEGGSLGNEVVTMEMRKMLYNESSAYRSYIKGIARALVKDQYSLYPNANDPTAPSSAEDVKAFVRNRVIELNVNMQFTRGPPDAVGNVTNFAHPAISAICSACFYSRVEQLGNLYPGEFKTTIPTPALALIVTAIKASLDEYTTGVFVATKFDSDVYSKVYSMMIANIDAVLEHQYHGSGLKKTLSRWARTASSRTDIPAEHATPLGPGNLFVDLTVA